MRMSCRRKLRPASLAGWRSEASMRPSFVDTPMKRGSVPFRAFFKNDTWRRRDCVISHTQHAARTRDTHAPSWRGIEASKVVTPSSPSPGCLSRARACGGVRAARGATTHRLVSGHCMNVLRAWRVCVCRVCRVRWSCVCGCTALHVQAYTSAATDRLSRLHCSVSTSASCSSGRFSELQKNEQLKTKI